MDKPTILIIDDEPSNLFLLKRLLETAYRVRAANSGKHGLRAASSSPHPDLVLLDIMMPVMDGYAVLAALRKDPGTAEIPVIFLTALGDAEDEGRGMQLGAADYISKPIFPAVLLARVATQLQAKQARDWMSDRNAALEAEVARRMAENTQTQRIAIRALAHLAEIRDEETGNHIRRTQAYIDILARGLRTHARHASVLTERYIDLLVCSAPLHDIGKVGIPDAILHKSGRLDSQEMHIMRDHARLGSEAIAHAEQNAEHPVEFLVLAKEIARWHHERWDGKGYPDGLAGEAIPVSARLMAVADVFDALVSPRCYKSAMPLEQARRLILEGSGSQFDPDVVDVFEQNFDALSAVAQRYRSPAEASAIGIQA